jgi:hypothetical protein
VTLTAMDFENGFCRSRGCAPVKRQRRNGDPFRCAPDTPHRGKTRFQHLTREILRALHGYARDLMCQKPLAEMDVIGKPSQKSWSNVRI